jgi:hypothetical protein
LDGPHWCLTCTATLSSPFALMAPLYLGLKKKLFCLVWGFLCYFLFSEITISSMKHPLVGQP